MAEWLEGKLFNVLNDYWQGPGAASATDTKSLTHIGRSACDSSCRSATDGRTGLHASVNHRIPPECLNGNGLRSRGYTLKAAVKHVPSAEHIAWMSRSILQYDDTTGRPGAAHQLLIDKQTNRSDQALLKASVLTSETSR